MKAEDLKPSRFNSRKVSEKTLSMLGKAMGEFGDLSVIVFNVRTGHLIGGQQRIEHLRPEWEIASRKTLSEITICPVSTRAHNEKGS